MINASIFSLHNVVIVLYPIMRLIFVLTTYITPNYKHSRQIAGKQPRYTRVTFHESKTTQEVR